MHIGTALVAFSALRRGVIRFIQQRYQVRLPLRLTVLWPYHNAPSDGALGLVGAPYLGGIRLRAIQKHWITGQFYDLRYYLQKVRQPLWTQYFLRLFR